MIRYILLFFTFIYCSCSPREGLYEQTHSINKMEWHANEYPEFYFQVADTSILYNVYFVLRYHNLYNHNNIRVSITKSSSVDSITSATFNFNLNEKDKWKGKQINDIIEYRARINKEPLHLHAVPYKYILQHKMQEDPLQKIMAVGIRIQKAGE